MKHRVRLLRRLGAGRDGTAWAALDEDTGRPLTLHRLLPLADDALRLRMLAARVRLLDLVPKRHLLQVREADLESSEPWLLVDRAERTLADALQAGPLPEEGFLTFAERLADAVAAAHRVGLAVGHLRPGGVGLDVVGDPQLCLCGLETGAWSASPFDAPAVRQPALVADIAALGDVLAAARTGVAPGARRTAALPSDETVSVVLEPIDVLLRAMRDPEPPHRPSAAEVRRRIGELVEAAATGTPDVASAFELPVPDRTHADTALGSLAQLGRFRLLEVLGEGSMGRVYRAEDVSDGTLVAVKVLAPELLRSRRALQRFRKEARLLAEVRNPFVANLIEANEDEGYVYMAVEYVRGQTLGGLLHERGPMPVAAALPIAADVARALVDVHARGVVHRDVKPDNVVLIDVPDPAPGAVDAPPGVRVKLIDFGIARHVEETESLAMTREGSLIGTPLYMSPEQCRGEPLDARTDVYAVGALLFELIVGRAPFAGQGAPAVVAAQIQTVPPRIDELRPEVDPRVAALIARTLEKDPARRPADASALLVELAALFDDGRRDVAAHIAAVPAAPSGPDGRKPFRFELALRASPRALWPYVSNTQRLNRAVGLAAATGSVQVIDGEPRRFGRARERGFALEWQEHPFEWVEGRRFGVLREYAEGPLLWLKSVVDLSPGADGGTTLVHEITVEPRGLLGRAAASLEIGRRVMQAFQRAYRRIDDLLARGAPSLTADPFEGGYEMPRTHARRLSALERQAVDEGAPAGAIAALGDVLRRAPAQEVGRLRPIALARRVGVPEADMVQACLIGARVGLLVPLWDLLCPTCRVPAQIHETLRAVKEHGRCDACALDFALDLAASIELVFRVHPSLREADVATYCIGSPAHTPHVAAQVNLAAGQRLALELALDEGAYLMVGRGLSFRATLRVQAGATTSRWDVDLSRGPAPSLPRVLSPGRQTMHLQNDTGRAQLVRIERAAPREDAFTAARALSHPLFRRLFPAEGFDRGALLRVGSVTLLLAEQLAAAGVDADRSLAASYAAYKALELGVHQHGGTVVKLQGDGVLAWFDDPGDAIRSALALPDALAAVAPADASAAPPRLRAAVHRGAAAAVMLNDRIDYFGGAVRELEALLAAGGDGELVVSEHAGVDPIVARLLVGRVLDADAVAVGGAPAQRFRLQ